MEQLLPEVERLKFQSTKHSYLISKRAIFIIQKFTCWVPREGRGQMKCVFCKKGETKPKKVNYEHYNLEDEIIAIFKNFPAAVCEYCGEEYYKAVDLKRAERMLYENDEAEKSITIPVIDF